MALQETQPVWEHIVWLRCVIFSFSKLEAENKLRRE